MEGTTAPVRPELAEEASQFMMLERAVEEEYRPRMRAELQRRIEAIAETMQAMAPPCPHCGQSMRRKDTRSVSWLARFGRFQARVTRYRCASCRVQRRPLLDALGVEPGRISGSLARLLALLAVVAPYPLAARLAWLLLGVTVSPMGVWRVAQRLGQAAADYSEGLSAYHADSRGEDAANPNAPPTVVLSVDGCALGMQVRAQRRRRKNGAKLGPLPAVEDGHFREVKTGVLLLPEERVEISPGTPLGGAALSGQLSGRRRCDFPSTLCASTGTGLDGSAEDDGSDRRGRGRMDLESRHVVRAPLRDSRLLARVGARLGVCPIALWRRFGAGGSVGPYDRRRSTCGESTGGDCAAQAAAAEDGRTAREPGRAHPLLQRERQPHAV